MDAMSDASRQAQADSPPVNNGRCEQVTAADGARRLGRSKFDGRRNDGIDECRSSSKRMQHLGREHICSGYRYKPQKRNQ